MEEKVLYLLHEDKNELLCISDSSYREYCETNKVRSLSQCPDLVITVHAIDTEGKKTENTVKLKVSQLQVCDVLKLKMYDEPGWHDYQFKISTGSNLIKTSWPNI